MKVIANSLRTGNVIEHNGKLWIVVKYETSQPGKGGSVMQVELKEVQGGTKDIVRFRTQENVEKVRLDQNSYQYLYADEDIHHFMDNETYEQITLTEDIIGEPAKFLQEGMIVEVESYEGTPLSATLPTTVIMEIIEADPVVKGQTASSSYKPAVLENGEKVMVPPHIESGTRIVVKTEDNTYVERAKD